MINFDGTLPRTLASIGILPAVERWKETLKVPSTDLEHTLDQIQNWLASCSTVHTSQCGASAALSGGFVPSRLVKVKTAGDISDICVVQHQDVIHDREADMRYMTLSYCWGSEQFLVLNKRTFPDLIKGMPIESLSKVFQEAIQLTRLLDVPYLWIDALCILQDSKEDWESEAGKMAEVYSNSFLNLAASTSTDGSGGLFSTRAKPSVMPWTTEIDLQITNGSYKSGSSFKGSYLVNYNFFQSLIDTAPLYKRAWVFQERILAPKTIHFAEDQMFWECPYLVASEVQPNGMSGLPVSMSKCIKDPIRYWNPDSSWNSAVIGFWQALIQDYCPGRLTVSSDKLIAISGIAHEVYLNGNLKPEQYVAGLWAIDLEQQLVWFVHEPGHGRRPKTYRAPSWSWAAVDGPICAGDFDIVDCLFDVEEAYTVPVADPFGAVKPGCFIRVKAHLMLLALPDSLEEESTVVLELASGSTSNPKRATCIINWDDDSAASLEKLTADRFGPRLIILMACHWYFRESTQERGLKGLVLKRSLYETGIYQRVGYFESVYETELQRRLAFSPFETAKLDKQYYETCDAATGKYTIKVL